jgi:hypothetical protein
MKIIGVGPMRIPTDQLGTLAKLLGATVVDLSITKELSEFRCCTSDEGCGDIEGCPFNLKLLFSHLKPGESQTAKCDKTGKLISVRRTLAREEECNHDI